MSTVTLPPRRLDWKDKVVFAGVDIASATTTELVAATAGQQILVYKIAFRLNAANNLTLKSASSAIGGMGTFVYAASGEFIYEDDTGKFPIPCNAGEAFNLTTSSANGVVGGIWYVKE